MTETITHQKTTLIIFPNQLFDLTNPAVFTHIEPYVEHIKTIIIPEHPTCFGGTHVQKFHYKRIAFHIMTILNYIKELKKTWSKICKLAKLSRKTTPEIIHIRHRSSGKNNNIKKLYFELIRHELPANVIVFDPVDKIIEDELTELQRNIRGTSTTKNELIILPTPAFILSHDKIADFLGSNDDKRIHYNHYSFYVKMRKEFNILIDKTRRKPEFGKWRLDADNRATLRDRDKIPVRDIETRIPPVIMKYLNDNYSDYGVLVSIPLRSTSIDTPSLCVGVDRESAKDALRQFVGERLSNFGAFQDTMSMRDPFLFHSVLSPLINVGLLLPIDVINYALDYRSRYAHEIPPNSIEGFIAQILGWREFTRAVYVDIGESGGNPKHIRTIAGNTRKLADIWYKSDPKTPFGPLNLALKHVRENAYCHHIERLMVIGQIMFMSRVDATEVYRWFMEFFLDSYDWVMVPNVYFMSQYATLTGKTSTTGVMTTRPYFSSSNYIVKMTDIQTRKWYDETTPDWDEDWDTLYWSTISNTHIQPFLQRNYILAAQVSHYKKKNAEQKSHIDRKSNELRHILTK